MVMTYTIDGSFVKEMMNRRASKYGNKAHVILPKEFVGKTLCIIYFTGKTLPEDVLKPCPPELKDDEGEDKKLILFPK